MTERRPVIKALARAERRLVEGLSLSPMPLDSSVSCREGHWKGTTVLIRTRAYRGPKIRYARFTDVVGGELEIGNLLCVADERYPLPLLGADLVKVRDDQTMIAADLSPTLPKVAERDGQLESLRRRRSERELPSGGTLPAWCAEWFSPFALYTRVGLDETDAALNAFHDFPDAFLNLARQAGQRLDLADRVAEIQDGYLRAHREDDKGLKLLGTMFGQTWAEHHIYEVLFPSRTDDHCSRPDVRR